MVHSLWLGAVLFRGFEVKDGIQFQEAVQQFEPKLSDQYRGTSPRRLIPGTQVSLVDELNQYIDA